jgi:3-oxosteroid 1-dehydrogenase
MTWDLEVDVVCVGSGLGGLTAAIVAHDGGCQVAVLEKASRLGGVCAYSGGEVFVPCNHKMAEAGCADDPEQAMNYLGFLAGGYADPALQRILFETGPQVVQHLERQAGVRWKFINGFPDYHYPHAPGTIAHGRYLEVELFAGADLGPWQKRTFLSPHMPPGITHDELFEWGGLCAVARWDYKTMGKRIAADIRGMGPGMMAYFIKAALLDRDIAAYPSCPLRSLVVDRGQVVGVRAEREGRELHIRARRGVVLATGGYDWNQRLVRYYEDLPEWQSLIPPSVEGDNLLVGGELGAAVARVPPLNLLGFFGYRVPGQDNDGRPLYRASWEGGYPHAIWVNRAGQRFADESFYREYLPRCRQWDGVRQEHPNYPPFLIFDQNYRDTYAFGNYLPGTDLPGDFVARADSPGALADKLGIDRAGLEATIARFNSFASGPTDPDFGRGRYPWAAMMMGERGRANPNLGPLDKPPYYGIQLTAVGAGVNAAGLAINEHAQVLHVRGHAIAGLYACGNAAAQLDIGAGYQSGLANLRGMTWGYLAGRHLAG